MSSLPSTSAPALGLLGRPGGVEVHLLRTRRFKTVYVHWLVEAPLDEGRTARALLPDLLTRGTARHPDLASLSARLEELYGTDLLASVTAHGPRQVLRFGVETLADRFVPEGGLFDEAMGMLADVLQRPPLDGGKLRADHLEQERENLRRSIEALADDKSLYAYRQLVDLVHAGTPYALHSWGEAEVAGRLDEATVHAAWDHVRREAPVRLLVVGDVTEEQALATAERLSGGGERPAPGPPVPAPEVGERPVRERIEEQPLAQSRLAIGYRLPHALLPGAGASLCATVLGGGAHSRLFKRVREAESLAYGCSASALLDSGCLVVQAGIDGDQADRVRELVQEEIDRLADEGLPDEEFELSVRAQRRRLMALHDAPAGQLGFRVAGLMTGRPSTVEEALDRLDAATPADVVAVAAGLRLDGVFLLRGRAP